NTSGLYGPFLERTIDRFRDTRALVRRPYRRGMCPVNPEGGYAVMERAFHPVRLELALDEYGFSAEQVKPKPMSPPPPRYFTRTDPVGRLKDIARYALHAARSLGQERRPPPDPQAYRYDNVGFQLVAVRR